MGLTFRIAEERGREESEKGYTLRRKKSEDVGYPGANRAYVFSTNLSIPTPPPPQYI
jgi:hypothetical protein